MNSTPKLAVGEKEALLARQKGKYREKIKNEGHHA